MDENIKRLNEAESADLLPFARDGRHDETCSPGCFAEHGTADDLLAAVERIVREHTDRALAEVEQRIETAEWFVFDDEDVDPEDEFVRRAEVIAIVRAARQERGR